MDFNEEKLESTTETVIAIPFGGSDDEGDFEDEEALEEDGAPGASFPCRMYTPPELAQRDLPDGPRLRMKAYEKAFTRCRERVEEVLRRIHGPTIEKVVEVVKDAYVLREEDRLMPYTELRVVTISGTDRSATLAVLEDVRQVLVESGTTGGESGDEEGEEERRGISVLVSTLASSDCSNLPSAMKTLISGFLETRIEDADADEEDDGGCALAAYDPNLLEKWYDKLRRVEDEENLPKLAVLVTDLERIDPSIMQDIFYICSQHVPRLPLVFVLGLSTPPTPSYLHAAFPRKTLALLRVTRVEVAGGMAVLERILGDTFFDPEFEPTIVLSPAVLIFIVEQFTQTTQSIDFVTSLLQLVHLRHFIEPLSILAPDEYLGADDKRDAEEKLSSRDARSFLLALNARLRYSEQANSKDKYPESNGVVEETSQRLTAKTKGKGKTKAVNRTGIVTEAPARISAIRQGHKRRYRRLRVAFRVICKVRKCLLDAGVLRIESQANRGTGLFGGRGSGTIGREIDLMIACLRGTVSSKELKSGIRRLDTDSLGALLVVLDTLIRRLPADVRADEEEILTLIKSWTLGLDEPTADDDNAVEIAKEASNWLADYISENTYDFTETELWDIWYTGNPTGIFDIFNPAPRTAIINALVHPERYLGNVDTSISTKPSLSAKGKGKRRADDPDDPINAEYLVPDTCLAFKGYLESGRMINVYDWFMSFKEGLEGRRRAARIAKERSGTQMRKTRSGRGKMKKMNGRQSDAGSEPPSPTKGRGRGRGRGRGMGGTLRGRGTRGRPTVVPESDDSAGSADENESGDESDDDLNAEERERWEAEVQARFLRSVQELDLLGFTKQTGRKADHVQKTVHEVAEYT